MTASHCNQCNKYYIQVLLQCCIEKKGVWLRLQNFKAVLISLNWCAHFLDFDMQVNDDPRVEIHIIVLF